MPIWLSRKTADTTHAASAATHVIAITSTWLLKGLILMLTCKTCNKSISNPRNVVTKYQNEDTVLVSTTFKVRKLVFCSHYCYQIEFDRQIDERELKQLQLKEKYKRKAAEYAKTYRNKQRETNNVSL